MSTHTLTPAAFIDRDGTIMEDCNYCSEPNQVKIFPGAAEALSRLKARGFKLVIVTNQSGIGRGLLTLDQYRAVEAEVLRQLGGNLIDGVYFCPHAPGEGCQCRKPAPGMILKAQREHRIDLARSFLIGDKEIDVQCAHNAGVRAVRVRTGPDRDIAGSAADWIAGDLAAAAETILKAPPSDLKTFPLPNWQ
jgi:histidinol-phosphate phosphatase family protein